MSLNPRMNTDGNRVDMNRLGYIHIYLAVWNNIPMVGPYPPQGRGSAGRVRQAGWDKSGQVELHELFFCIQIKQIKKNTKVNLRISHNI